MSSGFFQSIFVTLFIALVLLTGMALIQRGRKQAKVIQPSTPKEKRRLMVLHVSKLIGFTLITLLLVVGGVMVYISYQGIVADTAPAPSRVDIPPDLPFQVKVVTFAGGQGFKMAGWYVPARNGATILLLHGYGGNRISMIWQADVLVKAGYGVLMYDERASGESEGDYRSYGWEDPDDVGGALAYLDQQANAGKIGIAGCSIGGQIALQSAARYPSIQAVWADGPSTVTTKDIPPPFNWFTWLTLPSNLMMDRMLASRIHRAIPPAIIDIIGTIEPRAVMLVAGGRPNPLIGPESWLTGFMFQHAGAHATLWVIPEAIHCDGPILRPEEYAAKMLVFFDGALGIIR